MLGLFCYSYVLVHFSSYVSFDHVFDAVEIAKDIGKRPFITVGFASLVLLTPLALTSTNAMVRRLGAARWLAVHRLIYAIAPLAVLHFWWMVKRDVTEPAIYAVIVALLLGYRIKAKWSAYQQGRASPARA
jgi:methionine sulfoxide reductase heme-binding subunit